MLGASAEGLIAHDPPLGAEPVSVESYHFDSLAQSIYSELRSEELNYQVFLEAYKGYLTFHKNGQIEKMNVITIIDFDKSSDEKRFFVVDIEARKILVNSYVAHGQNTGGLNATRFSNDPNSHQSSLGFYLTDKTYHGKHGLSLRLDGLDKGINNNARKRNIVVHSADYVSEEFIAKYNRLGRSWGCPALPNGVIGKNTIKAFNETAELKVNKLKASLERSRWVDIGEVDEFIVVNVAYYHLYYIDHHEAAYASKVMVGKVNKQTPIFRDDLTTVVLNPTWTLPFSISSIETLGKLKEDPQYLQKHNRVLLNSKGETVSEES